MKKIYTIPTTLMMAVQQQMVIAGGPSVTVNRSSAGVNPGEFQVKEDRSSRSDYNVWNEDWNK